MRQIYNIIFFIILTFFLSKPVFAQNLVIDVPDLDKVRTNFDIGTSKEESAILLENPSKKIKTSGLHLGSNFYHPEFRDYWTIYTREPRHYISDVEYRGFHSVIHNQICRLAMKYYNQKASVYFNSMSLTYHPLEYFQRMDQFSINASDSKYRWWERSYQDSFAISQGGLVVESQTIGEELEILSIGPLKLSNSGRLSWENHYLDVTTTTEPTTKNNSEKSVLPEDLFLNKRRLFFGIHFLQSLLQTEDYNITGNVRLNLRVDQFNTQNKSGASGYIKFTAFYNHNPWLEVEIKGTARPLVKEYGLELSIQLLCF